MAATKARVICPHCGRNVALVHNGQLAHHGPHGRKCPGSLISAVEGPLTARQVAFVRHCWQTGDALPVARLLGEDLPTFTVPENYDADQGLWFLTVAARQWIELMMRDRGFSA